jgi:AcrR family transcriptional regulator
MSLTEQSTEGAESTGRLRILDEAASLFLRHGYAETSLRDIAGAAGMQAGSVYYHFASKDDILEEILRRGIVAVDEVFAAVAAELEPGTPPADRLRRHVRGHLGALFEHGAYTAAHVTVFHSAPPGVRAASIPVRDAYEQRWQHLLSELAPHSAADITLARLLLLGAMSSALEWFDPGGVRTLDDISDTITHQTLLGLGLDLSATRRTP